MFKKARGRADGNVAPPTQTVQCDWEQRDFTQSITLGLSQLTDFLNNFGATRAKAQLQPKPTLPVGGAGLHGLQPHRVAFNPSLLPRRRCEDARTTCTAQQQARRTHSARTHGTRAFEPSARHLSRHAPRAALRRRISKVEGQVQLIEQVLESVDQQGAKERSAM